MAKMIAITGVTGSGKSSLVGTLSDKQKEETYWINLDRSNICILPKSKRKGVKYVKSIDSSANIKDILTKINEDAKAKIIILDTVTNLLNENILETIPREGGGNQVWSAWGEHSIWFQEVVKYINKNMRDDITVIALAHSDWLDNPDGTKTLKIITQGQLNKMGGGLEHLFGLVFPIRAISIETIKPYESKLLTFTEKEKEEGAIKRVLQLKQSSNSNEVITLCSPNIWEENEVFMNADLELLLNTLIKEEIL